MPTRAILAHLSGLIKAKRREKDIGLRKAAEESKVSASTLSRFERSVASSLPDVDTLKNLAKWIGVPLSSLVNEKKVERSKEPKLETTEQVEVYLRADKNLSAETAEALSSTFKLLYKQFTTNQAGVNVVQKRKPLDK
jgi:transcriptional regulator with XRE-family HTH domain